LLGEITALEIGEIDVDLEVKFVYRLVLYLFPGLLNSGKDIRRLNFYISSFDEATRQIDKVADNNTGTPYHKCVTGKHNGFMIVGLIRILFSELFC